MTNPSLPSELADPIRRILPKNSSPSCKQSQRTKSTRPWTILAILSSALRKTDALAAGLLSIVKMKCIIIFPTALCPTVAILNILSTFPKETHSLEGHDCLLEPLVLHNFNNQLEALHLHSFNSQHSFANNHFNNQDSCHQGLTHLI